MDEALGKNVRLYVRDVDNYDWVSGKQSSFLSFRGQARAGGRAGRRGFRRGQPPPGQAWRDHLCGAPTAPCPRPALLQDGDARPDTVLQGQRVDYDETFCWPLVRSNVFSPPAVPSTCRQH